MSLEYDLLRMEYHMDSTHHVFQTGSSMQSGLTKHMKTSLHFSLLISAFLIFGNFLFSLRANMPLSSGAISGRRQWKSNSFVSLLALRNNETYNPEATNKFLLQRIEQNVKNMNLISSLNKTHLVFQVKLISRPN